MFGYVGSIEVRKTGGLLSLCALTTLTRAVSVVQVSVVSVAVRRLEEALFHSTTTTISSMHQKGDKYLFRCKRRASCERVSEVLVNYSMEGHPPPTTVISVSQIWTNTDIMWSLVNLSLLERRLEYYGMQTVLLGDSLRDQDRLKCPQLRCELTCDASHNQKVNILIPFSTKILTTVTTLRSNNLLSLPHPYSYPHFRPPLADPKFTRHVIHYCHLAVYNNAHGESPMNKPGSIRRRQTPHPVQ